ncbi:MAG: hypothetical protein ACPGUD_06170 [Parashewanella sp.]
MNDSHKGSYFTFVGLYNSGNYSIKFNKLVTDQQSNQQVRRMKIQFGGSYQASNFNRAYSSKNINASSPSDTVQITGQVEYCLTHPTYQEDLNAEVKLVTGNEDDGYYEVSKSGVQVTDDAIPVDFKGGNGSPLSIYIESGITETGINYYKVFQKDHPFDNIDLTLTPNDNESLLPDSSVRKGDITRLLFYSKNNTIMNYDNGASYEIAPHKINLSATRIDIGTVVDTDFNSLPSIQQTLNDYDAPAPTPGWYVPDVTVQKINAEDQPDTFVSVKSFSKIPPVIHRNDTKQSTQMEKLLEQGSALQNQLLRFDVFNNGRFYIVDSVDSEGRVKLKTLQPNHEAASIYFDFSKLSNGDITWWGSRVRWLIKDEKGNDKVQEGYFGWHAQDGSYAFLNLNDGVKSISTLPKKGDVIAFEFAKTELQS